ncbi:MAG: tetratricopeptide repeat protein [Candidatus Omnitrophica bacterium]|nr:tetratricopeptide repeat protein [Candidatus Omnitrophota bacterium]
MPKRPSSTPAQKALLSLFGIILFFISLELTLWIFSSVSLAMRHGTTTRAIAKDGSCRILCIGESTTAMGGRTSYPAQLEKILNSSRTGAPFRVINNGLIASNSSNIAARLEKDINRYRPHIILSMIGINDIPAASRGKKPSWTVSLLDHSRCYRMFSTLLRSVAQRIRRMWFTAYHEKRSVDLRRALELGWQARQDGRSFEAERYFTRALKLEPSNVGACFAMGWLLQDEGRLSDAESLFMRAIAADPGKAGSYVGMGWFLADPKRARAAEKAFKDLLLSSPENYDAYIGLGWLLRFQGRLPEAEEIFLKAMEAFPDKRRAYLGFADISLSSGNVSKARDILLEAAELAPEKDLPSDPGYPIDAFVELGWFYKNTGSRSEAREAFHAAAYNSSANQISRERALGGLHIMDIEDGISPSDAGLSLDIIRKELNPLTRDNYRRIVQIAEKNGVRLICVQYPLRRTEPLEQALAADGSLVFVENFGNFAETLRAEGYNSCFWDHFAGDFGHCTPEGNRLIAENAAAAILDALLKDRSQ